MKLHKAPLPFLDGVVPIAVYVVTIDTECGTCGVRYIRVTP